jgi:hypothetical protein
MGIGDMTSVLPTAGNLEVAQPFGPRLGRKLGWLLAIELDEVDRASFTMFCCSCKVEASKFRAAGPFMIGRPNDKRASQVNGRGSSNSDALHEF